MLKISLMASACLALASSTMAQTGCVATPSAPPLAAAVGYVVNTFSTGPFTTQNTDLGKTYAQGYQWYDFNFFGVSPTSANTSINSDGSISVGQGGDTYNSNLSSVGYIATAPGFVGTAFGGGAYIQAIVKFTAAAGDITNGWPSFWANALEEYLGTAQWPGQAAGYNHFTEADILEYFEGNYSDLLTQYSATLIDWYGITNASHYSIGSASTVANFSQYFTIAMLWVPATATTNGYVNYYTNGALIQSESYSQYQTSDTPPINNTTPWAFGIIDQNHMALQVGSNNTYPITVYSVQVWQANSLSNMHN